MLHTAPGRALSICGQPCWTTGAGCHVKIRISFWRNRPQAHMNPQGYRPDNGHWVLRTKPRIQRGNYPNEKTRCGRNQYYAATREIRYRDCLGTGNLCEYSPLSYPPPPGIGRWQTLQKLRQTDLHVAGQKGKTVLLGSVPDDLVERPPGTGSEESLLSPHLQLLRKGV